MNEINTTSGNLPEVSEAHTEAVRLHGAIVADAQAAAYHLISLGKNLREMNERKLYKELGFDSLGDYAAAAVGLKGRAAYNYISAYETYGEDGLTKYGALGITKLVALAQLEPEDRADLLEHGAEELSTRELQTLVDELKRKNEQLTFELGEMEEKGENSEELTAQLEDCRAEIERLTALVAEERKNKVLPAPQMSEAEKEEIRRGIEAETQARHAEEIKEAAEEAARKVKEEYKEKFSDEVKKTERTEEKLKEAERRISEDVERINQLNEKLNAEAAKCAELQASAEKKPVYSSGKEAVKAHFGYIKKAVEDVAELLGAMDDKEEAAKLRAGMIKTLDACKEKL